MNEKENKTINTTEASDPAWDKEIPAWFAMQISGHFKGAVDKLTAVSEENMEMKKIIDDMRSYFMLKHQHEQMAKRLDNMSKQILDEINHPERKNYRKNRSVEYDDDE